jgi:ribosomal-protein-alanine N-acetyltransferase
LSARIYIRPPTIHDQREFVASARVSIKLHQPWTVAPTTPLQFRTFVERMNQPGNAAFFICRRDNDQIIGVINVTNIILGLFRSAYLGYYVFAGYDRQGFMREGLQAVVRHAFRSLKLHRLEANVQPGNTNSLNLLKACGFSQEGYSPRYLKIGGRWRDHERWAILAS